MLYRFGPFILNSETFELRRDGLLLDAEPQVLSLLILLVENRDRLVTKDEIVDAVWRGRAVSDSAISSRLKSARRLVGDDGLHQRMIRTVHGRGVRFIGKVTVSAPARARAADEPPPVQSSADARRPSIAVLRFTCLGSIAPAGIIADAFPHDLIAELSRLRWLVVIARGSSFHFDSNADLHEVRDVLGVRYCVTGSVRLAIDRLLLSVELADTDTRSVVWADSFEAGLEDVHELRARILARITAALEFHIHRHEAEEARLRSPDNLDAWSSYHLGLQHMFRFNRSDNQAALSLFEKATDQDPGFARAFAGLSFTRFQNAFLNYSGDRQREAQLARSSAERAVLLDELDPFANLAMGRADWLQGDLGSSLGWIERATTLSPSYAHGVYSLAWTKTLMGAASDGESCANTAMMLSPIDPLHYAMAATRALSHVIRGDTEEASIWAERAAREPRAHVLIAVIAATCQALNGDESRARIWAANVRTRSPGLTRKDFFQSFPFADQAVQERISSALSKLGL